MYIHRVEQRLQTGGRKPHLFQTVRELHQRQVSALVSRVRRTGTCTRTCDILFEMEQLVPLVHGVPPPSACHEGVKFFDSLSVLTGWCCGRVDGFDCVLGLGLYL